MDTIVLKATTAEGAYVAESENTVAEESIVFEENTVAEESTAAEEIQYEFKVTPDNFVDALPIMGTGMLGIFLVMGVIIACVAALNKASSSDRKAKKKANKN